MNNNNNKKKRGKKLRKLKSHPAWKAGVENYEKSHHHRMCNILERKLESLQLKVINKYLTITTNTGRSHSTITEKGEGTEKKKGEEKKQKSRRKRKGTKGCRCGMIIRLVPNEMMRCLDPSRRPAVTPPWPVTALTA